MRFRGIQSIARNTALLTATQAVSIAMRLVYVVLVARLLGPDIYALLAYSQSWYLAFLPIALFGLGPALVHDMSVDRARAPDVAARALALRLLMTVVAGAASVGLAWIVAPDPMAPVLISILVLALAGRAVNAWAQHLFAAFESNQHALRQEIAFRAIELAAAIAILAAGGGVLWLVASHAAVWVAQAAWSVRVVRREIVPAPADWRRAWRFDGLRPLAKLAVPFFLSKLANDWRMYGTLILFGNLAVNPAAFAQFALAMQALAIASAAPASLVTAAQPALTRSAARGDGKDALYAGGLQRLGFILGAAAALAGMALGPALFSAVFGAQYEEAGRLLGLSLWCLIPIVAGIAWPSVAVARGDLRAPVIANIAGAVVTTVALLLLVPVLGATGAIAAAVLGYATTPAIIFWLAVQRGWADWDRELLRPMGVVIAGLAAYLVAAPISPWAALASGWLALAAGSMLGGVITRAERDSLVAWRVRP